MLNSIYETADDIKQRFHKAHPGNVSALLESIANAERLYPHVVVSWDFNNAYNCNSISVVIDGFVDEMLYTEYDHDVGAVMSTTFINRTLSKLKVRDVK